MTDVSNELQKKKNAARDSRDFLTSACRVRCGCAQDGLPPGWKEYTTATGATYFYSESKHSLVGCVATNI